MKIAILVLLGLCAFTAHAQSLESSDLDEFEAAFLETIDKHDPEYLKKLVEKLQNEAEENIKKLQERVKNAADFLMDNLKEFGEEIVSQVEHFVKEAVEKIEAANNNAKECVKKYRPELVELIGKARKDVQQAVQNAVSESQKIVEQLKEYLKPILAEVQNLKNIFDKCVHPANPIFTFKCLLENVNNVQASLKTILKNATQAARTAISGIHQLIYKTRAEIDRIRKETKESAQKIFIKIRICIRKGPQGDELLDFTEISEEEDVLDFSQETPEEVRKLLQALHYNR